MTSSPGPATAISDSAMPGLGALGADDLEVVVAGAAEHAGRRVAQRLDEVRAVLVEVLGA